MNHMSSLAMLGMARWDQPIWRLLLSTSGMLGISPIWKQEDAERPLIWVYRGESVNQLVMLPAIHCQVWESVQNPNHNQPIIRRSRGGALGRPYLFDGTLREQIAYPVLNSDVQQLHRWK